jgi:hypothetical protein
MTRLSPRGCAKAGRVALRSSGSARLPGKKTLSTKNNTGTYIIVLQELFERFGLRLHGRLGMRLSMMNWSGATGACLMLLCLSSIAAQGQQVIQRGAFGKPEQVLDDTGQWSTPLLVASDSDVQLYIPDVSNPDWLKKNYRDYIDRGTYIITMFTFYKTPTACRANQLV